jgi:4'-phosphopantetheinyl transferase
VELVFDNKDLKVYCFEANPVLAESEIELLLKRLPLFMQERINKYQNQLDKQLRIYGKLLLEQLIKDFNLEDRLHINQIQYTEHNQPFFNYDFFFSTAHARNRVVCAASKTKNVGVDIEAIVPRDLNEYINFLSDKELLKIQKSDFPLKEFYTIWTKKEALSKATGLGGSIDFKGNSVTENKILFGEKAYDFYELPVSPGFVVTLAVG